MCCVDRLNPQHKAVVPKPESGDRYGEARYQEAAAQIQCYLLLDNSDACYEVPEGYTSCNLGAQGDNLWKVRTSC